MTADKLYQHCQGLGIRLFVHAGELGVDAPRSAPNPWLCTSCLKIRSSCWRCWTPGSKERRESHRREIEQYTATVTKGRLCRYCGSDDLAVTMDAPPPHWAQLRCMSCDRFVGFAPAPLELAADWQMPYGHYRGMTLAAIAATDLAYLQWATLNMNSPRIREMCAYYLEHMAGKPRPPDGAARQPADDSVVAADEIPF